MKKLYYSISEVSELIGEEQHTLRYWEKLFEDLNPRKNRAGNRVYSEKDLLTVRYIKQLLREENLSIKGVNEKLKLMMNANFDVTLFDSHHLSEIVETDKAKPSDTADATYISNKLKKEFISVLREVVDYLEDD